MKKISLLLSLLLIGATAYAQGKFKFEAEEHDFGAVKEGDLAEHVFKFTNAGDAPIVITGVRASCGCTTPEWSKEPIMPGESGEIKAVFNSSGRPGTFYKTITVTSNAAEPVQKLVIRGQVDREAVNAPNPNNGSNTASISIDNPVFQFGKIAVGNSLKHTVSCTNTGNSELVIKGVQSPCRCVKMEGNVKVLKPGETVQLVLYYTPTALTENGEKVQLLTNARNQTNITFAGNVVKNIVSTSPLKETNTAAF